MMATLYKKKRYFVEALSEPMDVYAEEVTKKARLDKDPL